jgi:hypothetical protein
MNFDLAKHSWTILVDTTTIQINKHTPRADCHIQI